MRIIHKFPVTVGAVDHIKTHEGAEFVGFGAQGQELVAWVEFDPAMPPANLGYRVFATGEPIEPPVNVQVEHRFTAPMMDGLYIWHLYRVWPGGG